MPFFQLQNFMAASRKPNMKPFGLMAQTQDLSWIATNYADLQLLTITGTQNGVNASFTINGTVGNGSILFVNGVGLYEGVGYTRSGSNVTFNPGYIPQSTDIVRAFAW